MMGRPDAIGAALRFSQGMELFAGSYVFSPRWGSRLRGDLGQDAEAWHSPGMTIATQAGPSPRLRQPVTKARYARVPRPSRLRSTGQACAKHDHGGRSGIRTRDTVARMHAFQACAFNSWAGALRLARAFVMAYARPLFEGRARATGARPAAAAGYVPACSRARRASMSLNTCSMSRAWNPVARSGLAAWSFSWSTPV